MGRSATARPSCTRLRRKLSQKCTRSCPPPTTRSRKMAMTLEQAVSRATADDRIVAYDPVVVKEKGVFIDAEAWDVIRQHLSQPAQAVDVGAIREVVDAMRELHPKFKSFCHD